jgi:hypothetical protein
MVKPPLGKRRGAEKKGCPLQSEDENMDRILLKCNDTQRWTEYFIDNK